jgi:glycerol-3-phosphate dehydrogenase
LSRRRGGFCPILTIACGDAESKQNVAKTLAGNYIKTKITDDIIKLNMQHAENIYAIAAGDAYGLVTEIISVRFDEQWYPRNEKPSRKYTK